MKLLKNYAKFSGRAIRNEFWYFILVIIFELFIIELIDNFIVTIFHMNHENMNYDNFFIFGYLNLLYSIFMFIPSLSITVRRLHDVGKSGTYLLIIFIPVIGIIWLMILLFTDSNPTENQYGPNPKNDPDI